MARNLRSLHLQPTIITIIVIFSFVLLGKFYSGSVNKVNSYSEEANHENNVHHASTRINENHRVDLPEVDTQEVPHTGRENATFITLARNEELEALLQSIDQVERRFNKNHHYDWVFFNDNDFTEEFIQRVSERVSGEAKFGKIPDQYWGYPDFIDQKKAADTRERMKDVIYGSSESYRFMCRYESGFFWKHPLMDNYRYYWRVEPDIKFTCDIKDDPFRVLRETGKKYGFTLALYEIPFVVGGLWDATREFMEKYPEYIHPHNAIRFARLDGDDQSYNNCHFWSNFEVADLDFFRSEAYETYFNHLDRSGGFFYDRWGDAPVHSLAVSLLMDRNDLHWFKDIGYYHPPFQNCPVDPVVRQELNCECPNIPDVDPGSWYNFAFESNSCIMDYYIALGRE